MTLLQIKTIVLAVELGSISLAAKQMNISQSNASAYIADVEKELGITLLNRSRKGIVPTQQGTEFIEHAKKILIEQESILNINKLKQFYRLRVGSMNFSVARNIFNKLCIEHADNNNIDMSYANVSLSTGIEMLKKRQIDIVVGFIRNDLISKVDLLIESTNIEKKSLGVMKAYIRLRKNHPLTISGIKNDGTINITMLKDYPYIDYDSFKDSDDLGSSLHNNFNEGGIHRIFISDEKSRYEIMSKSDAYSMGRILSDKEMNEYGLTCIPIKNLEAEFCVLTRTNEMNNPTLQEFIQLLEEKGNAQLKN